MQYSYNQEKRDVIFANAQNLNASFKDLGIVCDAIRYKSVSLAIDTLDATISGAMPMLYKKHNKHMGARHELGGRKGRWPIKCAKEVRRVLVNAMANATNKGFDPELMYVVHASANKTLIAQRRPSKGALFVTGGPSGYVSARMSNLEFARVEIGLSVLDEKKLSSTMVRRIKAIAKIAPKRKAEQQKKEVKKEKKPLILKKEEKKEEKRSAIVLEKKPEPAQPMVEKKEQAQPPMKQEAKATAEEKK